MPRANSECYGVRELYFPQTAKIAVGVLAALVVIVNSLAMVSVLKNYRRLRQRIYVFVISLAAADILAGAIFLSDTLHRFFIQNSQHDLEGRDFVFQPATGEKYIVLRVIKASNSTREILETFKAGAVVLSILNTALVTFALYKRTTSMGRHHEDFKHMNAAFGPDGHSFLPAFDTMMRVLSIGTAATSGDMSRNTCRQGHPGRNGESSPLRRISATSRMSCSSPQGDSSFSKEGDAVLLEKYEEERGTGARKPQITKSSTEDRGHRLGGRSKSKRSASLGRLMNTGRRVSQALRSRSASGNHSYVGRHSYSVMSKRATGCSLFLIWLVFAFACSLPFAARRTRGRNAGCPEACYTLELFEDSRFLQRYSSNKTEWEGTNERPSSIKVTGMDLRHESERHEETGSHLKAYDAKKIGEVNTKGFNPGQDAGSPVTESHSVVGGEVGNRSQETNRKTSDYRNITACVPVGYRLSPNPTPLSVTTSSPGNASSQELLNPKNRYPCSSCSVSFYPLNKGHIFFIAVIIIATWCWLILSASRLLYLRKHSTNVFVRCSALWRFMFITALFFFITLAPYVGLIFLDFVGASSAGDSPLWSSGPALSAKPDKKGIIYRLNHETVPTTATVDREIIGETSLTSRDNEYLYPLYSVIATCSLLVNFVIAPAMYLIRLLGFRRIISAL